MSLSSQDSKLSSLHQHCLKNQPFLFPGTGDSLNHTPPTGDYGTNKEMIFIIIRVRIVVLYSSCE